MADHDGTEQKAHVQSVEHKNGASKDTAANLQGQFSSLTPEYHHDMTKRLLRKVDFHLLPLLILM
jgi:hypothetical protein